MTRYYYSKQTGKHYKLASSPQKTLIFWVHVSQFENGAFIHARGADAIKDFETGEATLNLLGIQVQEADYINALKDYFAIDKQVREEFIKNVSNLLKR